MDEILYIQNLVRAGKYHLTSHAEEERDTDQITRKEIEEAFYRPDPEQWVDWRKRRE